MVLRARENNIGAWAFLIGIILAVILGIFTTLIPIPSLKIYSKQIFGLLILLGIFVGSFIEISGKDSQTFLITGAILVVISKFGMDSVQGSLIGLGIGNAVSSVFGALLVLFVPATMVVALKIVFSMAKV